MSEFEDAYASYIDRRRFLVQAGKTTAAVGGMTALLAACGSSSSSSTAAPATSAQIGTTAGSTIGTATTTASTGAAGAPVKGGSLIVGIGQSFEDINVLTAFGYRWGQLMAYAMYDTLVKYDDQTKAVPLLAESWQTPDNLTTIVKIRQGVTFHNGKPMRVEDVVWSLNRIHDPVKPVSNNFLALPKDVWDKAEKVDETTLKITTKKPTRMIESFRFWFIMPENADALNLGKQPIGTGAFQYKNFVSGDRLELVRYDKYWNDGHPYLDALTFKFLADEATQIASFKSGDIQYIHDLSVAQLSQVDNQAGSKLIPSGLFFEWWQPQMYSGPLVDPKVRLALAWAFDRDKANKIAWAGKGHDTWNPFDQSPYFNGAKLAVSYDPERAKSELSAAGVSKLDLNMLILSDPGPWKRESQVLQQGFKAAGINATIESLPAAQWFDKLYTKRNHQGIAVNAGTVPFPWALIANYMMKATLLPVAGKPQAAPKTYDAYLRAFSPPDDAAYKLALSDLQTNMLAEMAAYHTMVANNQNVVPEKLEGVESTKIGDQRFDSAYFRA